MGDDLCLIGGGFMSYVSRKFISYSRVRLGVGMGGIYGPIGAVFLVRGGHRIWSYAESNLGYRIGNDFGTCVEVEEIQVPIWMSWYV